MRACTVRGRAGSGIGAFVMGIAVALGGLALAPSRAHAQGLQPPPPLSPAQAQQPGGLQPPPSLSQDQQQPWQAPAQSTQMGGGAQQRLTQAEKDDSGRGFEIAWANAEIGGGVIKPGQFIGDTRGGVMVGAGFGVRFVTWTLGVRLRYMPLTDVTAWNLAGEAGFHLPLGAWDPYVNVRAGYIQLRWAGASDDVPSTHGFDLGLSIGTDYYLSSMFSLGIEASGDVLLLKRSEYTTSIGPGGIIPEQVAGSSSTGFALMGSLHAALHFDL